MTLYSTSHPLSLQSSYFSPPPPSLQLYSISHPLSLQSSNHPLPRSLDSLFYYEVQDHFHERKCYANTLYPGLRFYKWIRPTGPKSLALNVDGARSNDRAGIGCIFRDCYGRPVVAYAAIASLHDSVDMIELYAIKQGLQIGIHLAISDGVKCITVQSDSVYAIEYISRKDQSSLPSNVMAYIEEIREYESTLASLGTKLVYVHVYRETNSAADFLSKYENKDEVVMYPDEGNLPDELWRILNRDMWVEPYLRPPKIK